MFRTTLPSLLRSINPALTAASRSTQSINASRQALAGVPSFVNQKRNYHDKVIDHVSRSSIINLEMITTSTFCQSRIPRKKQSSTFNEEWLSDLLMIHLCLPPILFATLLLSHFPHTLIYFDSTRTHVTWAPSPSNPFTFSFMSSDILSHWVEDHLMIILSPTFVLHWPTFSPCPTGRILPQNWFRRRNWSSRSTSLWRCNETFHQSW